jgi:ATPase subunit of ABC transporter with duplicated ATPase domains
LDFDEDGARAISDNSTVESLTCSVAPLLGAFGLKGSAAHQMPATFSGGERAKLALAILASSNVESPVAP